MNYEKNRQQTTDSRQQTVNSGNPLPAVCRLPSVAYIVIPARLESTRLPRKMLLSETGKPLIQYAYEAARKSRLAEGVCVACDHREIFTAVEKFGGQAIMTDPNAQSGTDRIAEVAQTLGGIDIIVNVQGDEPEMDPAAIDAVIQVLADHPDAVMATACVPIRDKETLENPACVKVVFDKSGKALYFSRSVIPHPRTWSDSLLSAEPPLFYLHLGLYAYRKDFLLKYPALPPCALEKTESLEQLRVLDCGFPIMMTVVEKASHGIDTPDDYRRFVQRIS